MRSQEFIIENDIVDVIAQKLKKHCQPYLNAVPNPLTIHRLYRGLQNVDYKDIVKKRVRLDSRVPSDMPLRVHNKVNDYFREQFGEPFRDSMFATGSQREAEHYGGAYIIFPMGNFTALWAPEVSDMYSHFHEIENSWQAGETGVTADWEQEFYELIQTANWSQDITAGIRSGNEIMVRCSEYIGLRSQSFTMAALEAIEQLIS